MSAAAGFPEAIHTLFDSVEAMLEPEVLSDLLQRPVRRVALRPFEASNGFSSNTLHHVDADGESLVLKRLHSRSDWIALATDDERCRSVRVWQYGLLDRLEPALLHERLAACHDGDDHAILMRDVSAGLVRSGDIGPAEMRTMLDGLAALHAEFWEDERLGGDHLGLVNAETIVTSTWPRHWHRYRDHARFWMIEQGWAALFDLLDRDVEATLRSLIDDPEPLMRALARYPKTLLHGDFRLDNLALLQAPTRLVAFDWQLASFAPPTLDLAWFLMSGGVFRDSGGAEAEHYRRRLAEHLGPRWDPSLWRPMVEVGSLIDILRKGSWHALFATTSDDEGARAYFGDFVTSYNGIVREGVARL